jgi:hypothetical protein
VFDGPGLPMSILFFCAAAVFITRGPFGRAVAERLSGRARTGSEDQDVRELKGEVEELRNQLSEVQERLDFAERLLARQDPRAGVLPRRGAE